MKVDYADDASLVVHEPEEQAVREPVQNYATNVLVAYGK